MKQILFIFFLFIIIIAGSQREQFAVDLSPYFNMDDVTIYPDGIYFLEGEIGGYYMKISTAPNIIYGIVQDNRNALFIIEDL